MAGKSSRATTALSRQPSFEPKPEDNVSSLLEVVSQILTMLIYTGHHIKDSERGEFFDKRSLRGPPVTRGAQSILLSNA